MRVSTTKNNFKPLLAIAAISLIISFSILAISANLHYYYLLVLAFGLPASIITISAIFISSARLTELLSKLHWWHVLWFLMFASGLVLRIRDTDTIQQNPLDIWALYRIGLMGIVAFVLIARLLMRRTDWFKVLLKGSIGLLAGYAILGMVSTLWSVYPTWTLYKSTEYLIDIALIAAIVIAAKDIYEFKTLFDWTWLLIGLLAASAWLGLLIWPSNFAGRSVGMIGLQLSGVLPAMETNKVGELGAILGIVALNRFLFTQDKKFYFVLFFAAMLTLVFAQSRSPITGFLVAIPFMLFAAKKIGPVVLSVMLLFSLLLLTGIADTFWEFFQRGQDAKYFATLSGRTRMWELGWEVFKDSPLIGYGAYAGARFGVLSEVSKGVGQWSSILNTWLEVLLGVGVIGWILVAAAFIRTWFNLLRVALVSKSGSLTHILAIEAIGILALLSIRSIFTTTIIWHPPMIFLLVMGYSEFLYRHRVLSRKKNRQYGMPVYRSS